MFLFTVNINRAGEAPSELESDSIKSQDKMENPFYTAEVLVTIVRKEAVEDGIWPAGVRGLVKRRTSLLLYPLSGGRAAHGAHY